MDHVAPPVASTQPLPVEAIAAATWVTVSRRRDTERSQPPVSPRRVLTQVVAGLAVVLVLVGLLGSLAAQRLAEREAVNDAATIADVLAEAVITPALTDALADGEPAAVAAMDVVVRERVLGPRIVRVKLWSPDGQVVYADEPQLVGRTFALSADQRAAISSPQTKAEVSDLDASENEFETGGRLLEVYRPVWTPSGRELLFETYSPYDSVSERSGQLWRGFAGVTVSSLLMLVVLTAPILWRLLRRLGDAQRQRERLLERTVEASDAERRRIAATLHDGPVQELVASAFVAAGSAAKAESSGQPRMADDLRGLAASVRGNIRTLRSLLVDIYPPSLASSGLATTLADLAQTGASRGLAVHLDVADADNLGLGQDEERLVYRVAQECLRNSATHAAPCTATIRLAKEDDRVVLDVLDDGPGFDTDRLDDPEGGHFGLRVLADLASDAGAVLQVASQQGSGTHWRLVIGQGGAA
jgi:two-component system NarL family sensor kinase